MPYVLHIDDNEGDAVQVEAALRPYGRVVRPATTLEAGLEALRAETPDAVLLDLGLPGTARLEALEAVLPLAQRRGVSVTVLTARPAKEWRAELVRRGADGFIEKRERSLEALGALLEAEIQTAAARREHERERGARAGIEAVAAQERLFCLMDARIPADLPAKVEALTGLLAPLPGTLAAIEKHLAPPSPPEGATLPAPTRGWGPIAAWRAQPPERRQHIWATLIGIGSGFLAWLSAYFGFGGGGGGAAGASP